MDSLFHNFIGGGEQALVLLAVIALWALLSPLGLAIAGRDQAAGAAPIYGWALASLMFTVVGVFSHAPFTYVALALLALTFFASVYVCRRGGRLFAPLALKAIVLAVPLLLLTSAMAPSQWDEFSNWLPNIRFLAATDGFPGGERSATGSVFPAYPYGWPLLCYMASKLAGRFLENAGGVLNVMILLTFGMVAANSVFGALSKSGPLFQGWRAAALAVLLGFAFNPTFSQKIAFTAYADTPLAAALGIGGILGWLMLNALADGDDKAAKACAWQFGLVMSVAVNLKQVGLVLFIILAGSVFLAGMIDQKIRLRQMLANAPAMAALPIVIYALWRYYVASHLPHGEFSIQPLSQWNIDLIPQILIKMLGVLSKKGAYLALMLAAVGFAIRGMICRRTALDRLAIIVGFVFLAYNAFLFFTYVASFGAADAASVASYWRYNMHLGPLSVMFGAYGFALFFEKRLAGRLSLQKLGGLAIILALALPVVFSGKIRFDHEPPKPHFIAIAKQLTNLLPAGASYAVLDPKGSGESVVITSYFLGVERKMTGFVSAFNGADAAAIKNMLEDKKPNFVLTHSATPEEQKALSRQLPDGVSHLLSPSNGGWKIINAWPYPKER